MKFGFGGRLVLHSMQDIVKKRELQEGGAVQVYVDNEVIRRCDRRVPVDSHTLVKSAKIHTKLGTGKVVYVTPYAKKQYYTNTGARQMEPLRKGQWFELMKNAEKKEILEGAKKVAGGKL